MSVSLATHFCSRTRVSSSFFLSLCVTAPTFFPRVSSVKVIVAAMLFVVLTLALLLPSIKGFVTPKQSANIGRIAILLPTSSASVTISQAPGALPPQRPHLTAVNISITTLDGKSSAFVFSTKFSTPGSSSVAIGSNSSHAVETDSLVEGTVLPIGVGSPVGAKVSPFGAAGSVVLEEKIPAALNAAGTAELLTPTAAQSSQTAAVSLLTNDTPARSTTIPVGLDGDTTTPNVNSHYMESIQTLAKISDTTPGSSTTTSRVNLQTFKGKATFIHGTNTSVPSTAIEARPDFIFGTQTITAKSTSRHIFLSDQSQYGHVDGSTLTPSSTTTPGSGTSTTVPALQTYGTQSFLVSGSSTLLPSYGTTTPDLPKTPSLLTISGQTMTANSLNQYEIDGQTLTPGGVAVVSGTTIYLAPDESAIVVGTSTETLSAKVTAGPGSGSNVTGVQPFRGSALGARDGLWSSSMVILLVGIAVLLWM